MRKFSLTEYKPKRLTVLLLNGGGQQPYNKFHKITKFFSTYDCNIVSIELPGHGKSKFNGVITAEQMLDDFYLEFSQLLNEYNRVGLVGFSLGALLSLKCLDRNIRHFEFVISIGAGVIISQKESDYMRQYATIEFFESMGWVKYVTEYHKEGWEPLIESLPPMLRMESELFSSTEFNTNDHLYLIVGSDDTVVDFELQKPLFENPNIQGYLLEETGHFDYFSTSWEKTQRVFREIMKEYF